VNGNKGRRYFDLSVLPTNLKIVDDRKSRNGTEETFCRKAVIPKRTDHRKKKKIEVVE